MKKITIVGLYVLLIGLFLKDPIHVYVGIGVTRNQIGGILVLIGIALLFISVNVDALARRLADPANILTALFLFYIPVFISICRGRDAYMEPLAAAFFIAIVVLAVPSEILRKQLIQISIILCAAVFYEAITQQDLIPTVDQVSGHLISSGWLHSMGDGNYIMRAAGFADSPHKTAWTLILICVLARPHLILVAFYWIAILLTGARLPLFGFSAYLLSFLFLKWWRSSSRGKWYYIIGGIAFAAVVMFLFSERFDWALQAFNAGTSSNSVRLHSWMRALDLYYYQYSFIEQLFGRYSLNSRPALFYISPESDWLSILLTIGLFGVFVMIWRLAWGLRNAYVCRDLPAFVFVLLCILLMGHSLVQSTSTAFLFFIFLLRAQGVTLSDAGGALQRTRAGLGVPSVS